MESKKDNFEYQKESLMVLNNHYLSTVFSLDKNFVFLLKKTERIVSALYLIAGIIPDQELICGSIKKTGLELLSYIAFLSRRETISSKDFGEIKNRVIPILSLIDVAAFSGFISAMNTNIIRVEIEKLLVFVEKVSASRAIFSEKVFGGEKEIPEQVFTPEDKTPFIKDNVFYKKDSNKKTNKSYKTGDGQSSQPKRQSRREEILAVFKKNPSNLLSIKDVAVIVKNCSEKTIQRELINLVESGILKKTGERRWSKYSMV